MYMYLYLFKKYNYKWNSGPTDLMYRSVFYLFSLVPTSDWGNVWRPRATGIPSGFGKRLSGSPGQFVIFPDYMWQPLTCTEDPLWHGRLTIIDAETSVNSAYVLQLDNYFNLICELLKSGLFLDANKCGSWETGLPCTPLMLHAISGLVQALWKVELPLWLSESPAVEIINTVQEFTLSTQWKSALCWWLCPKPWSNKISFVYKTYLIMVSALLHVSSLKAIPSIFKNSQVWWLQNILTARTLRFRA